MFCFYLLVWLNFIQQVLLVEAVDSVSNDTNNTVSQSPRTTLMLSQLLDGYDKRLRPNFGGPPCKINISIHVLSIVPIKEIDMEVSAVIFFRQHWTDPRLVYGSSLGISKMKLSGNIVDQVWLPDTFFVNDLSDQKSISDFLFELSQEGDIVFSYRRKLRLYCPMNLQKFPMDEQVCDMNFESYGYSEADIIYSWLNPDALHVDKHLEIPQYTIVARDQDIHKHEYSTGNFTSLTGIFRFKRKLGFYILQEFVPTILIVAVSWVGFWIDERSVPARVSLGITTVLAITTLLFGIQASLPRVGYVKAIDVFLFGSFVFVFAALVEYAIICTFPTVVSLRKGEKSKQKLFQTRMCSSLKIDLYSNGEVTSNGTFHGDYGHKQDNIQEKDHQNENYNSSSSFLPYWFSCNKCLDTTNIGKASPGQREPCIIDKNCRKLFPLAYTFFLSIYFVAYLYSSV